MALEDLILSILTRSQSDQFAIFRQLSGVKMSEIGKAIASLERQRTIHVAQYRRNERTGVDVPIYALGIGSSEKKLDLHSLLAGVTSERLVEYDFVARNLVSRQKRAKILDIGSAGSGLAQAIIEFGGSRWQVIGMDIIKEGCDVKMDTRFTGFAGGVFDQIISISTIEHIGLSSGVFDDLGDLKAMQEIFRILDKAGSVIISVPYGKLTKTVRQEYRVYNRQTLGRLVVQFLVAKKEFYRYSSGKWSRCSEQAAEKIDDGYIPAKFHSGVCVCLLLKKKMSRPQMRGNKKYSSKATSSGV